jgi:hypothetical protein
MPQIVSNPGWLPIGIKVIKALLRTDGGLMPKRIEWRHLASYSDVKENREPSVVK